VGAVLVALLCIAVSLLGVLATAVLIFRLACLMARVPVPGLLHAAWVIGATSLLWVPVEGVLAWVVHLIYDGLGYPQWEAGLVTFFLGLPVDLLIASGVHAALLRMRFGKAVEVWFAHRLILLTIVMAVAGVAAVAVLATNK
jgi:hypothetical protein